MASTKFEVSMEIFKFQGEPDVSVTLTGKSPAELDTALKTLETIAKTTTLYDGDSAPEAEKSVTSEPKQAAPVVSTADKKAPPREAGKLAYARRRKGAHAPSPPGNGPALCSAYDYLPERVPGQTPGMPRPLRTVCGEQGGIPEDEAGVRRERPKPLLP
jgi:hypothetical protein